MTAPPAGALEACLALLEKATPGKWEVVQGDEWTTDIGTPEGEYDDGRKRHWNVASVNRRRDEWDANRHMIAAAINLLKDHGPALLAALRLREEWMPIESAPKDGSVFLAWRFYPIAVMWVGGDSDYPWRASMLGSSGVPMHGNGIMDGDPSLTHWMPLPAPPTADDLARVLEEGE